MRKASIQLNIQKPAIAVEIFNPWQLHLATGFTTKTSYALWAESIRRLDFKTLETLCRVFECDIGTILILKRGIKPKLLREGATRRNGHKDRNKNSGKSPQVKARTSKR